MCPNLNCISLVEIGSVVSEGKIFFKFHPPFFLFLAWWPPWLEVGITGHNFVRGSSKHYSTKVCCISIMMSFLTYITGLFMNFELLPILTDYAN
jgi:hypothetical protein